MDDHGYSRRTILAGGAGLAVLAGTLALGGHEAAQAAPAAQGSVKRSVAGAKLQFRDLTHKLDESFNFSPGTRRYGLSAQEGSGAAAGMLMNRIDLVEHTATHIDVPAHFDAQGASVADLTLEDLIVPLAILDMREKRRDERDVAVEPADILAWEARHGRLPEGCCVAVFSGFDPHIDLASREGEAPPPFTSPGFASETADFLRSERDVRGLAVDSMSIDVAHNIPAYPVHQSWLRTGRWAIEGLTGLEHVPPAGALLCIGAAPLDGATGVPIRAFAIF